jgi:hypothetical protein
MSKEASKLHSLFFNAPKHQLALCQTIHENITTGSLASAVFNLVTLARNTQGTECEQIALDLSMECTDLVEKCHKGERLSFSSALILLIGKQMNADPVDIKAFQHLASIHINNGLPSSAALTTAYIGLRQSVAQEVSHAHF